MGDPGFPRGAALTLGGVNTQFCQILPKTAWNSISLFKPCYMSTLLSLYSIHAETVSTVRWMTSPWILYMWMLLKAASDWPMPTHYIMVCSSFAVLPFRITVQVGGVVLAFRNGSGNEFLPLKCHGWLRDMFSSPWLSLLTLLYIITQARSWHFFQV